MVELRGQRALVFGLGVNQGGAGVARYLVEQGAEVRVTDMQDAERLQPSLDALADLPIQYTLGRHNEAEFAWADLVVRNPGVPRESPWLDLARRLGARIEMEMTLFFQACSAPIIGVTGTKGKTTTTTMIAAMLREQWPDVRIAGNMGRSAVLELADLQPDVPVVLEISSFQIEGLIEQHLSPHVAVITNIAEDHLDRYDSLDEYAAVKAGLARYQNAGDWLVSVTGNALLDAHTNDMPAQRAVVGEDALDGEAAFWIDNGRFSGRLGNERLDFGQDGALQIPGDHARANALAAIAAATVVGVPAQRIAAAIPKLAPIADRMEPVATIEDVTYINDTTATVPVAAIAALRAFEDRQLIVIAGGSEKKIDLAEFAAELAERAAAVVLLDGGATPELERLLRDAGHSALHGPFASMAEAVACANALAGPGDVVLLSPGCASFGMFQNEFDRGRQFRAAVQGLMARDGAAR